MPDGPVVRGVLQPYLGRPGMAAPDRVSVRHVGAGGHRYVFCRDVHSHSKPRIDVAAAAPAPFHSGSGQHGQGHQQRADRRFFTCAADKISCSILSGFYDRLLRIIRNGAQRRMKSKLYPFFVGLVFVLLSYGTYQGLVKAPTEETMGEAQRIFYYHVPAAIAAYTLFFLNFLSSIIYLWKRSVAADSFALATAEVGVVFATATLALGMIWARYAWGTWWVWDMRLTTFLILWLLYVSYLTLRRSSEGGSASVLASALAIFAFLDVPFSYMANQWFRTNHPQRVIGTGNLDPRMGYALMANMIAFLAFGALIAWFRYEVEVTER